MLAGPEHRSETAAHSEYYAMITMADLILTSSLTDDEIADNFKRMDFFSGIMSGLEGTLAYEKGNAKAATIVRKRSLPDVDPINM